MAWTSAALIREALGPSVPVADADHLDACAAAANDLAYRKRAAAGYHDDPIIAPDAAVTMGTTLYGVSLWRQRASSDGYPSFEDLSGFQPVGGSWGEIKRLLGIGRGAVDSPAVPYVDARARRARAIRGW